MAKKEDEKVIDADRPELATNKAPDEQTLSHNWQPDSPAVDLRYVGTENATNVVAEAKAALEDAPKPFEKKEAPLSEAEYERRTNLDVSDKNYINPSLDHHKVK